MPSIAMYDQDAHIGVDVPQAQSRVLQAHSILSEVSVHSVHWQYCKGSLSLTGVSPVYSFGPYAGCLQPSPYPACSENQAVLQRMYRDVIDGIAMSFQTLHRAAAMRARTCGLSGMCQSSCEAQLPGFSARCGPRNLSMYHKAAVGCSASLMDLPSALQLPGDLTIVSASVLQSRTFSNPLFPASSNRGTPVDTFTDHLTA